jgi:hypothetical protein
MGLGDPSWRAQELFVGSAWVVVARRVGGRGRCSPSIPACSEAATASGASIDDDDEHQPPVHPSLHSPKL